MDDEIKKILQKVPADSIKRLGELIERGKELRNITNARENFMDFVRLMWPEFIHGRHHTRMAEKFEKIARKELRRVIINMPPRHTKSEFASYLLPAWLIGRNPKLKIIQTTHTAELAVRFGRKVRNLMTTAEYKKVFPDVTLREDSSAAGRWETNQGGEYFAVGTGGAVTGRGADLLIIDDPHSEQDALSSTAMENAYEWYTSGPRQRLQPGGSIVLVMTRWLENDLTGMMLRKQATDILADKWDVIQFPAVMPSGRPLWPEFWPEAELQSVRGSLTVGKWEAQWQQNPTSESSAILKRNWWKRWKHKEVPKLDYILQSYDTAYSKQELADFSAITTWGVFTLEDQLRPNIILVDACKGRWDFPELRRQALENYKYWEPDSVLIEAKASGMPLTQELRNMGIPVMNYSPSRGNDKISRVNSITPLLEGGLVWAPESQFADEVIEECAAFPGGEYDDYVDTVTQALRRFREGGFVRHPEDYEDKRDKPPIERVYY